MDTKIVLTGIISFIAGAILVSVVATTMEKSESENTSTMQSMAQILESKTGDEFDKAFLSQMIMHHQDAVTMAKMAENQAYHMEIKELAKEIIQAQEKEVSEMQGWQQAWGFNANMNDDMQSMGH
jgi:uncharacterized protein (DUF305 family)